MESAWQDFKYACRSLSKTPILVLTIVLSLAFGIGINTAVFTVLNEVLWTKLPFKDADRIVNVNQTESLITYDTFQDYSDAFMKGPFFDELIAFRQQAFWITDQETNYKKIGIRISGNPFHFLGVQPVLGRYFRPDEDKLGAPLVTMISNDFWKRKFGGNPDVLGKTIRIDGVDATIVGIFPKFPNSIFFNEGIWLPMSALDDHKLKNFPVVFLNGKLKSAKSIKQAQDWMNSIAKNMGASSDFQFELKTIRDTKYAIEKESVPVIWLWMGAAAIIFLITCANVVCLLLARAASRQKEFAIRSSMGASQFSIVRLQLMETLILCTLGGFAGFVIAYWVNNLFVSGSQLHQEFVRSFFKISANINWTVAIFTLAISIIAGLASGLLPAIRFKKQNINSTLMATGQHASMDLRHRKAGYILVIIELSLAVILISGAGLLIKELFELTKVDGGFQTKNVVTMDLQLPPYKYSGGAKAQIFYEELLQRLRSIPGVELASSVLWLPTTGSSTAYLPVNDSTENWKSIKSQVVSPDYFRIMGIGLIQGRFIGNEDRANTPQVTVVSESFAKQFFPGQSAVGKVLKFDGAEGSEIVGVVKDVRQWGLDQPIEPLVYGAFAHSSIFWRQIIVRTTIPLGTISKLMEQQVRQLDPNQPVGPIRTMDQVLSQSLDEKRLKTLLLTALSITGLLISMFGVYALISFFVACRTHEMGIRIAIGAQKKDILKMVTKQGALLAIAGLIIGVAGSLALSRFLSGIIYGISSIDLRTLIIVCVLFLIAAILASYFPARRASRVDPIVALRHE
jgi:putative ABC transport system permease protein